VFTRFIPPPWPEDMRGAWQDYYPRWQAMTRQSLEPRLLGLVEPLRALVPPAHLCDKAVYSAFGQPGSSPGSRRSAPQQITTATTEEILQAWN